MNQPVSYGSVVQAAWNGLSTRITARGLVLDTCMGTTLASDNVYCYHRPANIDATHGVGPVILAGSEMIRLLKNDKIIIRKLWRTYHYVPNEQRLARAGQELHRHDEQCEVINLVQTTPYIVDAARNVRLRFRACFSIRTSFLLLGSRFEPARQSGHGVGRRIL